MKNRILFIIAVFLISVYMMSFLKKETHFNLPEESHNVVLKTQENIINIDLEEYIIGVVAAEMPALYEPEALKAQAIASRTYAMYKVLTNPGLDYDLVASVDNQAYITDEEMHTKWQDNYDKYYERIKEAVYDTKGLVLKSNNEVIPAYYFAISNGKTENVEAVFGSERNYLISVDSSYDKNVKNYEVTTSYSLSDFCYKLDITCDEIKIHSIEKSNTNHVTSITINDKRFKGTEVRKLLNLRSTDFDIVITNEVKITTRGYGHGVGMSQSGANELAKRGYNYEAILHHYYQNVTIENI